MDKDKVPQDDANMLEGKFKVLKYAVDKDGKYTTVKSVGWEPENVALEKAWDVVNKEIAEAKEKVLKGELSPLGYHMAKNMMDEKLLSKYAGLSVGKIRDHLKPVVFASLNPEIIQTYAHVFKIDPGDIMKVE
jgi:hypothetical protein